jgi:predicted metal-binding protein
MADRKALETIFHQHGFDDYRWIDPKDMVVAHWVRMKCVFGCPTYGKNACCPPNTPPVEECRAFFQEYNKGVIFHFAHAVEKPEDRHPWSKEVNQRLSGLEREVFLAGYNKAFLLFMDNCYICGDCGKERSRCVNPRTARPSPEGMAVDVFSTVREHGYPIDVLTDYRAVMNRYAFLLVE